MYSDKNGKIPYLKTVEIFLEYLKEIFDLKNLQKKVEVSDNRESLIWPKTTYT